MWFLLFFVDSPKTYSPLEKIFIPLTIGLYVGIIVLILAFLSGYYSFYRKKKILKNYPYSEFEYKLGFQKDFLGKNNTWRFTEEILTGRYEGFQVQIHPINETDKKRIGFTVLTDVKELDDQTYKQTFKSFEKEDIYFGLGSSSKVLEIKKADGENFDQIITELTIFIQALKAVDLKPRDLKNG